MSIAVVELPVSGYAINLSQIRIISPITTEKASPRSKKQISTFYIDYIGESKSIAFRYEDDSERDSVSKARSDRDAILEELRFFNNRNI